MSGYTEDQRDNMRRNLAQLRIESDRELNKLRLANWFVRSQMDQADRGESRYLRLISVPVLAKAAGAGR